MTLGKRFIASCIAAGSMADWLGFGNTAHLFKPGEIELYEFVHTHCKKFGKLPQPATIEAHLGEEVSEAPEPPGYYHELMEARFIEQELKRGMKAASEKLGVEGKDPAAALQLIAEAVMTLMAKKNARLIVDFRDAYEAVIADYVAKYTEEVTGIMTGWPTLDAMTGGLVRGDFLSMVGRPGKGKTWQMLYNALSGWQQQDACQLFVSMEMKPLPIQQRLAAMYASVPAMKLKNAELSTGYLSKLKSGLLEVKTAKSALWIVDGNFTSTVEDIWMLARQLKPDGIWVDGGYLVKHPTERDRYKRVAENADLMKQELSDLAPTAVSWQFAKPPGGKNKPKKQHEFTLDDIGYTDAIAQVSSVVLGLLAPDSVETVLQREVDILKGRNGETGKFRTRWDFVEMDFSEVEDEPVTEMQFA